MKRKISGYCIKGIEGQEAVIVLAAIVWHLHLSFSPSNRMALRLVNKTGGKKKRPLKSQQKM